MSSDAEHRWWKWVPSVSLVPPAWRRRYREQVLRHPVLARLALTLMTVAAVGLLLLLIFISLLFGGTFGPLPSTTSLKKIEQNLASEVYAADGELLGRYYIENRLPSNLDEVSEHVVNAVIVREDVSFYDHGGVDYRAWGRVLVRTLLMQDDESGGGSTITQQLAKNLFPRKKYLFGSIAVNKAREIVIARRLEKIYSKEEILALYLNTISFSGNVFGIEAASMRFFDIHAKDLTADQAALLIGMLKATTAYHPLRNPERSKQRRNTVMERMAKNGFLTQSELDSLLKLPIVLNYKVRTHNDGIGTHFREYLRLQLETELKKYTKPDGTPYNIYRDGLKIYTTLDARLQRYAEAAVKEEMRKVQANFYKHFKAHKDAYPYGSKALLSQQVKGSERYRAMKIRKASEAEMDSLMRVPVRMTIFSWENGGGDRDTLLSPLDSVKYYLSLLNTGFLAVEPSSGKLLAWVGGINFKHMKFDHVISKRQVGSTFKPVLYAEALQSGMSPCKNWHNKHITYEEFENWAPRNVDEKYGGWYNMENALKKSINTIAVQVILEVGVDSVRNMARRMGITSPIPKEAGIALGGVDLTLYEMVNAFATIANRGKRPQFYSLTRIETADGQTIAEIKPPNPKKFVQAMQEKYADMLILMLRKVVQPRGTAGRFSEDFRHKIPVAAKTGTSNEQRDGWFIGFTPDLAVGAWVGGEHPQVRFHETRLGQGSSTAMPICSNFLDKVYDDKIYMKKWEKHKFPEPDSLTLDILDCYKKVAVDSADLIPVAGDSTQAPVNEAAVEEKLESGR